MVLLHITPSLVSQLPGVYAQKGTRMMTARQLHLNKFPLQLRSIP